MTLVLTSRADFTLAAYCKVSWQGESVALSPTALDQISLCRAAFLQLIDTDPDLMIYGVTTAMGELASVRLSREERDRHARIKAFAAATSFGDPFPDRVIRGFLFARLANFIEGNAATTPRIALAVAEMLDGRPLPMVAASGQGGAGEILALYPLFADLTARLDLEVKERGSLINGAPCAAALVADAALVARRRLAVAEQVFALSIEALGAPIEHYDAALDGFWGDAGEAAALAALRRLLAGAGGQRRGYQAPVSYRVVPKLLGQAHRATMAAEQSAAISLASVSDNPVFIPPDEVHPFGRCISTGGYHNGLAAPAMDDLSAIWADLCLLADRHCTKLLNSAVSHMPDMLTAERDASDSDGHGALGYVPMATSGYLEQARAAAQRTFLQGTEAAPQDDVAAPGFFAWTKQETAGRCLDACLAGLAVLASQALFITDRQAPPALRDFLETIRTAVPPVGEDRVIGPELAALAARFGAMALTP